MENQNVTFDDIAASATRKHEILQARVFYEQAVGRLLEVMSVQEVKEMMEFYHKHLDENS